MKKKFNIKVSSRFKICNVSHVDFNQIEKYFQSRKELASLKFTLKQKNHKDVKMLQTNLNVIAVGEPSIDAFSDCQKSAFFEELFSKIVELHKETQKQNC